MKVPVKSNKGYNLPVKEEMQMKWGKQKISIRPNLASQLSKCKLKTRNQLTVIINEKIIPSTDRVHEIGSQTENLALCMKSLKVLTSSKPPVT